MVVAGTVSVNDLPRLWGLWADRTVDGLRQRLVRYARHTLSSFSGATDFTNADIARAFDGLRSRLLGGY